MECRGWCAAGGLLVMFPLLQTIENGEMPAVTLVMPWWYWLVFFGVALLAIAWGALVMRPGEAREVQELEAQLEHGYGHAAHDAHAEPARVEAAAPPVAEAPPEQEEVEDEAEQDATLADVQAGPFGEVVPDDLTLIEGIGPKISSVLHEAGLRTYAQLAEAQVVELQALLETNGLQMHDPASWPQQAALARDGEVEKLQQLQAGLKGGRQQDDEAA